MLKNKDLIDLLNRAAAVVEDPDSEGAEDRAHLVEQLVAEADARQALHESGEH